MWDKSHECLKYTDSNITQNYIETVFEKWDGLKKGLKKTNKQKTIFRTVIVKLTVQFQFEAQHSLGDAVNNCRSYFCSLVAYFIHFTKQKIPKEWVKKRRKKTCSFYFSLFLCRILHVHHPGDALKIKYHSFWNPFNLFSLSPSLAPQLTR